MIKRGLALSPKPTKFSPLFFSGNLEYGIKTAADLGFDGVEISVCNPDELDPKAIFSLVNEFGLEVVTIATGQSYVDDGLPLVTDDGTLLCAAIDRLKKVIDFAHEVGSLNVTLGGVRGKNIYASHDEMVSGLVDPLQALAEYAGRYGVGILLEPVNRYEVSTIFRLEQAYSLLKNIDCENLKLLYDVYHANIEEASIIAPIIAFSEHIGSVHFADSNRLTMFSGHIDFFEIIKALDSVSYDGYVTVEALPLPDDMTAATRAKQAFDTLFWR